MWILVVSLSWKKCFQRPCFAGRCIGIFHARFTFKRCCQNLFPSLFPSHQQMSCLFCLLVFFQSIAVGVMYGGGQRGRFRLVNQCRISLREQFFLWLQTGMTNRCESSTMKWWQGAACSFSKSLSQVFKWTLLLSVKLSKWIVHTTQARLMGNMMSVKQVL